MNSPRLLDIPTVRTTLIAAALLLIFKLIILEETITLIIIGVLLFTAGLIAYLFKDIVNQSSYLSHFIIGVLVYYFFVFILLFSKLMEEPIFKEEAITGLVFGAVTMITYYFMRRL